MPLSLQPDFDDRTEVLYRLSRIESILETMCRAQEQHSEWIASEEFCRLVGIKMNQLSYYMSQGTPCGTAVRNVGTPKRPRYRFHRKLAVDQFLSRAKHAQARSST